MVSFSSKLPKVGTTIFSQMSQLAAEHGAINLSQGFPDFEGPSLLKERVAHYLLGTHNQYSPMTGVPALRQAIASKIGSLYGADVNADSEVTVTSGATEAIFCGITAFVSAGDEVIVFDPAYDCYEPAIELAGATAVHLPLLPPAFGIDWPALEAAITPKTRMIIINNPHNPSGAVFAVEDLERFAALLEGTDILLLGDEVYEHIVFDGKPHLSLLGHKALRERSLVVSSFGKTYHTTGWKVGYVVAPAALSVEIRKVHQYVTFSTSTPFQLGLADYLVAHPEHHLALPAFYQAKRDEFCSYLQGSRFSFTPAQGTYFQVVDYSAIRDIPDVEMARWLTTEVGVAAIPFSVFYQNAPQDLRLLRFCFAKGSDTLQKAASILSKL
ncbi:pyridoxal phosphate-dependent aminotransferase [Pokkaliibacter sp. CJK22405]|uniref:pyridoxal phosphate-dependent aminotransferase n=1 Tax=Pokkaliibacter sp. CJK22405 TaxID=3384615 RepID=UPI0039852854